MCLTAPAAAANAYGTGEEPRWRSSRPKDPQARAVDPEADEDAYAECYPGMAGFVGALVDSDDEGGGDLSHMDSKQAGKGKTRADFTTDEEWQKHKETRETLPRAAFQYGVKRADGRKSHKELEKGAVMESKQRDQKLDGQLRKIKTLLDEKGHEHEGAFARKPKEAAEGGRERGGVYDKLPSG
ncbi:Protein Red [Tetrabaena socialis]|uniref:Protein Red n=1 Tax=Tetrabaena socialis TaxID=47790 RepID=A0A2J8AGR9_9CHLO|nr:Protein Red [Tetrabaena socialis]|eukprot:PNH11719.1 Protein Red [Tetrabaena socialis]